LRVFVTEGAPPLCRETSPAFRLWEALVDLATPVTLAVGLVMIIASGSILRRCRGALQALWLRVGFTEPETVERLLVQGTLAGAIAGVLGTLAGHQVQQRLGDAEGTPHPAAFTVIFAAAALLQVLPRRHTRMTLLALVYAAALLPLFLRLTPTTLPHFFTVPLGLTLALEHASWPRRLVALAGPSLGGAWCLHFGSGLVDPGGAIEWVVPLASGLFLSAGAALAWLSWAPDEVEPMLVGRPKVREAWVRLRAGLRRLPLHQERGQLEALARARVLRCLSAWAERDGLARALDGSMEQDSREGVRTLRQWRARTADPDLEAHLSHLLRIHQDRLEQLDEIRRKLERLDVSVATEAAWLETAAITVEVASGSAPGLAGLASRLQALSNSSGLVSGD
jgi:hypothetical protein